MDKPSKTVKKTDKQLAASKANLAKGRKKRMDTIQMKKETKEQEYDLSSNEDVSDSSDSDNDSSSFVVSKKKPKETKKVKEVKDNIQTEVNELKQMV